MDQLTTYLQSSLPAMTDLLAELVSLESQTEEKAGVDRVGKLLSERLGSLGAELTMYPQAVTGDHVLGIFNRGAGSPIAMIMHMDTVHPAGTLSQRPVRVENGRLYGPGSYDMKASHV